MSPATRSARRLRERLRDAGEHAAALTAAAVPAFFRDRCPQLAAGISYFALLSVFPLAIVLTAGYGLIADDPGGEDAVADFIVERLPLQESGRQDLRNALEAVAGDAGAIGLAGAAVLLYTASALIAAVRNSVNEVSGIEGGRAPLKGKLLDILLVFGLGSLFALSLIVALLGGVAADVGAEIGIPRSLLDGSLGFVSELLPVLLALLVFTVALTVVPAQRRSIRDVWPGILVATAGYKLVQVGFSFYLENFSRYSAIYGSLGAVIAFMVFVYLAAMAFMLGAEYARLWPRARAGELEPPSPPDATQSLASRVRGWLRGLWR